VGEESYVLEESEQQVEDKVEDDDKILKMVP